MNLMRCAPAWWGALWICCLLGLTGTANARTADSLACETSQFPLIIQNVRILEDDGTLPNPALTESNISCTENGVLQEDLFRVTPPTGLRRADVVIIIDTSGSMGDEILEVQNNVNTFAAELESEGIDFRLGLVEFGNSDSNPNPFVYNGGNLTGDVQVFQGLVNQLDANGFLEPGFEAIAEAATAFDFRPGAQIEFILISDEDNDITIDPQLMFDLVLANDIRVHTAVDCTDGIAERDYCDENSIRGVSGGLLFPVTGSFEDVITAIGGGLNFYEIAFSTSNPALDGVFRRVECTIDQVLDPVICEYTPGAAPMIERTLETIALDAIPQPDGGSVTLAVNVTDLAEPLVDEVTVSVRTSGTGAAYTELPMSTSDGTLYSIQVGPLDDPGLDYFFRATDGISTTSLPSTDPSVLPFQIAVLPNVAPQIDHTPVAAAPADADVLISADVVDDTNVVAGVTLFYRELGTLIYTEVAMAATGGDSFSAFIPGAFSTGDVEYYIRAVDDLGVATTAATADDPFVISAEMVTADCDLDDDGDVDRQDLMMIFTGIGQPANGGDARDTNGDGFITIGDVRFCVTLCDQVGCPATP